MTKTDAQEITGMLSAYYTNWHPSDQTLDLYETLLLPLDAALAKDAVMHLMRTSEAEFVPKVATIARLAAGLGMAAAGTPMLSAEEAWGLVEEAMRRDGYYRTPQIKHSVILRAIEAMDWRKLCSSENPVADRAHFFRIFEAYQERGVVERIDEMLSVAGAAPLQIEQQLAVGSDGGKG